MGFAGRREEPGAAGGREQHAGARFADDLENIEDFFHISDVKDGKVQPDVAKMTRTCNGVESARLAELIPLRRGQPHSPVQGTERLGSVGVAARVHVAVQGLDV